MDGGGWDGSGREWAGVERGVEKWRSGEGRRGGDDGKWWWRWWWWGRMGGSWLEGSWVVVVEMESEQRRSCEVWKIWRQFGGVGEGVWEVEGGSTGHPNFPG